MIPALVLTAGLATRLRPLSFVRAKAAMPVGGEPIVRRILRELRASGIQEAVLNLHHLPHTITRVVGDGSDLDMRVRYSWEQPVLGSAGGPRQALPLLDAATFLIVNGDTLTDVDIAALVAEHKQSGALVTMAVVAARARREVRRRARRIRRGRHRLHEARIAGAVVSLRRCAGRSKRGHLRRLRRECPPNRCRSCILL